MVWPSPFAIVLILGFFYLLLFRWMPRRERQHNVPRKRQLEALLKELDALAPEAHSKNPRSHPASAMMTTAMVAHIA